MEEVSFFEIFKSRESMIFVLLLGIYGTVDKISYLSIQYSMNSVGIGFGAVMLLTGITQFLAYLTLSKLCLTETSSSSTSRGEPPPLYSRRLWQSEASYA